MPASTSRITCPVGDMVAGLPIRYQISGSYGYAVITDVGAGYIDVSGPAISGTLTGVWVGTPEMVAPVDLFLPGAFASTAGAICSSIGLYSVKWPYADAWLVRVKTYINTVGDGLSTVNILINGTDVLSGAITSNGGDAGSTITLPEILPDIALDVDLVGTSADDTDLTVTLLFVLE